MSICARAFRSSPSICGSVPTPAEAYLSMPGCDFANWTRSATELADTDGCTARTSVVSERPATGANVSELYPALLWTKGYQKRARAAHQNRMAVRFSGHDRLGANGAPRTAGPILDNHRLSKGSAHFVRQKPRHDVRRATGRRWHNKFYRPIRERLRAFKDQQLCDEQYQTADDVPFHIPSLSA